MSWFLAFAGFSALIILHELGHFVAAKLTGVSKLMSHPAVMFAGQESVGFSVSFTVTVKLQCEPSEAAQVMGVVPFGNTEPEAGEQVMVSGLPHTSAAAGTVKITTAEHWPGSVEVTMFAGQVIPWAGVTDQRRPCSHC